MGKEDKKTLLLVKTSLLMALTCVTTIVVQIPSPTQGYINLGDCFVLLSGWMLGPLYGAIAGGVGSALTDLLMGYSYYAPATLLFKGLSAMTAALIFRASKKHRDKAEAKLEDPDERAIKRARVRIDTKWLLISGICGEIFIVAGYFGYSTLILGRGATAALSIPGNVLQATVGIIVGTVLYHIAKRIKLIS